LNNSRVQGKPIQNQPSKNVISPKAETSSQNFEKPRSNGNVVKKDLKTLDLDQFSDDDQNLDTKQPIKETKKNSNNQTEKPISGNTADDDDDWGWN